MDAYQIYLFDWDGTLADSTPVWIGVIQEELVKLSVVVDDHEVIKRMGDWRLMMELGVTENQFPAFCNTCRHKALTRLRAAPLFPGADDMLRRLKSAGTIVGVVTSMHEKIIGSMLSHHGYETFFDVVVNGTDVNHDKLKPAPDSILLALKRLKAKTTDKVLMAGDADRDIQAAHNAGVDSLLFFPPAHAELYDEAALKRSKPTFVLDDWRHFVYAKPSETR